MTHTQSQSKEILLDVVSPQNLILNTNSILQIKFFVEITKHGRKNKMIKKIFKVYTERLETVSYECVVEAESIEEVNQKFKNDELEFEATDVQQEEFCEPDIIEIKKEKKIFQEI